MTKDAFINYKTQECLIEADGFDLIVMGRPEGPGCYCYANTLCKKYVDEMADNYAFVVLDNEAGMEHLSRRTTHNMDLMFTVTDSSVRGIQAAKRIEQLVAETQAGHRGASPLIVNRRRRRSGGADPAGDRPSGADPGGRRAQRSQRVRRTTWRGSRPSSFQTTRPPTGPWGRFWSVYLSREDLAG